MQAYHDQEWGVPLHDDRALFELLTLEGAQAGLSWRTVLHRRQGYREVFDDFDLKRIAAYTSADIEARRADPRIIRNRAKIQATVGNAQGGTSHHRRTRLAGRADLVLRGRPSVT